MSSELSPIETGQTDLTDRVCDRVLEILKYKNENPEEEWSEIPELVYMDIESPDGTLDTISIKKFIIFNYENRIDETKSGLEIELYYIPSKISLRRLSRIKPLDCEINAFKMPEGEKTKIIRELYGRIPGTTWVMPELSEEEKQEFFDGLSTILTPKEMRVLRRK